MVTKSYKRQMVSVYSRVYLRRVSAFRSVSYEAVCVIARKSSLELLVEERSRHYGRRFHVSREDERKITIDHRQQRWEASDSGKWIRRLIPDVGLWYGRPHGEVDSYVTQLLTGHGCFRAYQYRFKLDYTVDCPACQTIEATVEHVFLTCICFAEERNELWKVCGGTIAPDNVVNHICDQTSIGTQ
nr:uncharacterized protein LOC106679643 [Halyomorpha halys]